MKSWIQSEIKAKQRSRLLPREFSSVLIDTKGFELAIAKVIIIPITFLKIQV